LGKGRGDYRGEEKGRFFTLFFFSFYANDHKQAYLIDYQIFI